MPALTIWRNQQFPPAVEARLRAGLSAIPGQHRLSDAPTLAADNLTPAPADPACRAANVAFGQPHIDDVLAADGPRFVQLSTAGYTRYDTAAVREAFAKRNALLANASGVYAAPCAQHVLGYMLAEARQLPQALHQSRSEQWQPAGHRARSRLLDGQSVLILGYGAIARELVRLLGPFKMSITGVRRQARGDEGIEIIPPDAVDARLGGFDHVVNILPASPETKNFFDAGRLSKLSPPAVFYNIGRGDTVDQDALVEALKADKLAAAYLDVAAPEPLPAGHPLWKAPRCFITPHTAGGMADEWERLVDHFLANLARFADGEPLQDRLF
ncbi:MAG: D-2-hydroxyacid dehydrogenase [Phycisphaerae bacterium]